jgi:hypothetical protein
MDISLTWKWASVFNDDGTVTKGVLLNDAELHALAKWLCGERIRCRAEGEEREKQRKDHGGYCDSCRDDAAWMITQCPYIDITRVADAAPEAQPDANAA